MIPKNITADHILRAIKEIDLGRKVPSDREAHKFHLKYNGKVYPPKFVISLANKYANGEELPPSKFSGGDETNPFLRARGFEVALISDAVPESEEELKDEHDYAPTIGPYLEDRFGLSKIPRIKRNTLRLPSGSIIHTKKSSEKSRWYGLDTNIYEEFIDLSDGIFLALSLDGPEKTFVLPKERLLEIFDYDAARPRLGRTTPRWMIRIRKDSEGHDILTIDHTNVRLRLQPFLNRWTQIEDFHTVDVSKVTEEKVVEAIKADDVELLKDVLTGERMATVAQRTGQSALRKEALKAYSHQCAMCDIKDDDMLIASHIVPWSKDKEIRGVLENVICLCRVHDTLFEKGKLLIMDDYTVSFSESFLSQCNKSRVYSLFKELTYPKIRLPSSKPPHMELLKKHRESFNE